MNLDDINSEFGTIFEQFRTEDEKKEAVEEFSKAHKYGKEAAILSDLQSNRIADLLGLASDCFRSGNEEFAFYYLDKYIQKNPKTKKISLRQEDKIYNKDENEENEDYLHTLYFCYDYFESDDPIISAILRANPKKYFGFNVRFEDTNGELYFFSAKGRG